MDVDITHALENVVEEILRPNSPVPPPPPPPIHGLPVPPSSPSGSLILPAPPPPPTGLQRMCIIQFLTVK